MPFFRCGGATLAQLARKELGNRLRSYCGDNFVLSITWVEGIYGNIDGVSSSESSVITVQNYSGGFGQLGNFMASMHADFSGIASFLRRDDVHAKPDPSDPYTDRWGNPLWRKTSADSTNAGGTPVGENPGYDGTMNVTALLLSVPGSVPNLIGFDLKMFEQFKSIAKSGGEYSLTLHNSKNTRSITFNIPSWLPELFEVSGYKVTLPSNVSENMGGTYRKFDTQISTLFQATYTG